jgi:hypothetical protein
MFAGVKSEGLRVVEETFGTKFRRKRVAKSFHERDVFEDGIAVVVKVSQYRLEGREL